MSAISNYNVIILGCSSMVNMKEMAIKYTFTKEKNVHISHKINQLNTKEYTNAGNEGQKSYKTYRKQI